jgi:hypothetical protein
MSALAHPCSEAVIDFPAAELTKEFFGTAKQTQTCYSALLIGSTPLHFLLRLIKISTAQIEYCLGVQGANQIASRINP